MLYNEQTQELVSYQYDYGVPVIFDAGEDEGFSVGEKVIFVFDTDKIENKEFTVNAAEYSFPLKLEKAEADALFTKEIGERPIHYSAKRYNASNQFLETLIDSDFIIKGTLKWQN